MTDLEHAQERYNTSLAAYKRAETEKRETDAEWEALESEWADKRTTAVHNAVTKRTEAWHAEQALNVAYANAAAATIETFNLEDLRRDLRGIFHCRSSEKRERYVEAVLRHLVTSQRTHKGTDEETLKSVSILRDPRGPLQRENYQWLTERQRTKVWATLQRYCPTRTDSGKLAPGWQIFLDSI